jgi:hypothetical protein
VIRSENANRSLMLNILLFNGMSPKRLGKNGVSFPCVPNPPMEPNCVVCNVWRNMSPALLF